MDSNTVYRRIVSVFERYTDLRELKELALEDAWPTKRFLSAYEESDAMGQTKGVLLRAILGDTREALRDASQFTEDFGDRLCAYLLNHPSEPLNPFSEGIKRDEIPHMIRERFGRRFAHGSQLAKMVLLPQVAPSTSGIKEKLNLSRDLAESILSSYCLTPLQASRILTAPVSATVGEHFFSDDCLALTIRNAFVFSEALFASGLSSGDAQDKLSIALTKSLDLRKNSVPEFLFTIDVLSLGILGCIDIKSVKDSSLRNLLDVANKNAQFLDMNSLALNAFARNILRQSTAETIINDKVPLEGKTYTSLLFNTQRIVSNDGKMWDLRKFHSAYAHINEQALWRALRRAEPSVNVNMLQQCRDVDWPIAIREKVNVLRLHDICNAADAEFYSALPAVAKYAFGMPEWTGRKTDIRYSQTNKQTLPATPKVLPEIEDFIGKVKRRSETGNNVLREYLSFLECICEGVESAENIRRKAESMIPLVKSELDVEAGN